MIKEITKIAISETGKPDSASQKALKFSNSKSSATSMGKIWPSNVVTVSRIFVAGKTQKVQILKIFRKQFLKVTSTTNNTNSRKR